MTALNVLYIHHAGAFGGASRSLLELIEGFPADSVMPHLVTQRGGVAEMFSARGMKVIESHAISQFDHTRYGYYRGRRWLLLAREAFFLPFTLLALVRARLRWPDIDVVHVNEIVAVAAIIVAKWFFRVPLVVHVRSVQSPKHASWRSRWITRIIRAHADAVIAIDETVRGSLPPAIRAEVVHNAYTPRAGESRVGGSGPLPARIPGMLRVAMVGNLLPMKGVTEFLEAARIISERGCAVEFVIVGGNTRNLSGLVGHMLKASGFASDMEAEIDSYVAQHGLQTRVRRFAFTPDIDAIYRDIDVLCFPSLLDAPGRPVFEAAYWGAPSIVAMATPAPDTLVDGETGFCVTPGDAGALAGAIERFSRDPQEVRRMGQAARALALANFDARKNAARVFSIYCRLWMERE